MVRPVYVCFAALVAFAFTLNAQTGSAAMSAAQTAHVVDAARYPGTDLGVRIQAADAALGGSPGTIAVNAPGTIGAALHISPQHSLRFNAPVTIAVAVTLSGNNAVTCSGPSAVLTATVPERTGIFEGSGVSNIDIEGCTFSSKGASIFFTHRAVGMTIRNNQGLSTGLFNQPSSMGDGSDNVLIEDNTSVYKDYMNVIPAVVIGGPYRNVLIQRNEFHGGWYGVQLFADDGKYYPTLEGIATGNNCLTLYPAPEFCKSRPSSYVYPGGWSTVTHNTCYHVEACAWGSMMYKVTISDNVADTCHDTCFDAEASAYVDIVRNRATGAGGGGDYGIFFSSFHNTIVGNVGVSRGEALVFVHNASQDASLHGPDQGLLVAHNQFSCPATNVCPWVQLEASHGTDIENNTVLNGIFAGTIWSDALTVKDNRLRFTVALPAGYAGLGIPSTQDGSEDVISGNIIQSDVPQAADVPCMAQTEADYNNWDTISFLNNQCTGGWRKGIALNANGGNQGVGAHFVVRGNRLPSPDVKLGGSNARSTLDAAENCVTGASNCR